MGTPASNSLSPSSLEVQASGSAGVTLDPEAAATKPSSTLDTMMRTSGDSRGERGVCLQRSPGPASYSMTQGGDDTS